MTRFYALRLYARALAQVYGPRLRARDLRHVWNRSTSIWDGLSRAHYTVGTYKEIP